MALDAIIKKIKQYPLSFFKNHNSVFTEFERIKKVFMWLALFSLSCPSSGTNGLCRKLIYTE